MRRCREGCRGYPHQSNDQSAEATDRLHRLSSPPPPRLQGKDLSRTGRKRGRFFAAAFVLFLSRRDIDRASNLVSAPSTRRPELGRSCLAVPSQHSSSRIDHDRSSKLQPLVRCQRGRNAYNPVALHWKLDPIDVLQSVSILRGRACHWFASGRGRSEHECHVLGREHFKVVVQEMNCGTDPANVPRLDCYIHMPSWPWMCWKEARAGIAPLGVS
jgi:hypothetical protein